MTLLLSYVGSRFVVQTSDRLLTERGREYDVLANKSLFYWARDACIALSYSGLGHLEGMPTDEWIARKITGETQRVGPPGGRDSGRATLTGTRLGPIPRWYAIGDALVTLRHELERAYEALPKQEKRFPPDVLVSGFQWPMRRKGLPRPVMYEIDRDERTKSYRVTPVVERQSAGRYHFVAVPPPPFTNDEWDATSLGRLSRALAT